MMRMLVSSLFFVSLVLASVVAIVNTVNDNDPTLHSYMPTRKRPTEEQKKYWRKLADDEARWKKERDAQMRQSTAAAK